MTGIHLNGDAWVLLALAVLVVFAMLARAVGHLAKAASAAAVPAPAPKPSGGRGKLLLLAGAVIGGGVLWERRKTAAAPAKAAPVPAPTPTPQPTVTRTVTPHVTHFTLPVHLTGGQYVLLGPVLRRSS